MTVHLPQPHDGGAPADPPFQGRGIVRSLNIGAERENPAPRRVSTGIFKEPVDGPVAIADPGPRDPSAAVASGAAGDFVGDRAHHGGRFQALYAFDRAELDRWERELDRAIDDGMFGENLTLEGVAVDDAVIGEVWEIGTARLRVTEPRIPCGTFAGVMQEQGWIRRFTQRARSGAYLAVESAGEIRRGDEVRVASRPGHGVTVAEAFRARTLERELVPRVLEAGEDLSPKLLDRLQALADGADPQLPS
ncbi:MOSC domain-containing protein [Kocuria palustris]|uniref:MOSC domain-containing protein n=1 Tax=Kocuria palustris TaxID=71999 RepID=UPI0011A596D2|nr:MOSC domain-containing protein [Kocuria palustris]